MANVSHASLTGSNLHEPKGVASAAIGTVYVANGSGSGSWTDVGTASFTGMIADFITPVAPTGWLECDGTVISTTTYSALYNVMVIHSTCTRTNGSPILTSIASTTTFKVGYFVFGTGIPTGSTIVTIDSPTQITISNNATSSGTAAFDISPWLLNTGTIKLPDTTTAGRFRRSRASTTKVGDLQADQNQTHTHTGTTGVTSNSHTHGFSGTTAGMNANATHSHSVGGGTQIGTGVNPGQSGGSFNVATSPTTLSIGSTSTDHGHTFSGSTDDQSATHTHTFTTAASGATEARPLSIVVITCVKT